MNFKKLQKELKRNYDKKTFRKLKDMKEQFFDQKEANRILKEKNPLIYNVYIKNILEGVMFGLTVLNSGSIGREYYMTKGHKHKKKYSEVYILLEGKGSLILQNKKIKIQKLKKGKKVVIPATTSHRLVNTGKTKMEVLTIYNEKAGHNYKVRFKKRLLK